MSPKHRLPKYKPILVAIGAIAAVGLVACGSDSTTTVQNTPAPQTVTRVAAPPPQAPAPAGKASSSGQATQQDPPDVLGLSLPEARKQLSAAGYRVDPENTDTTFGIIVEENYTICEQDEPRGNVVHVLAQKYGC